MANFIANVKAVLDDSELIKLDNLCNKERTANVKIKLSGDVNQLDNVNRSIEDIRNNARSPIQLSLNAGQVVTQLNAIEAQLLRIQAIHLNLGGNGRTRNANNEITRQYNNAMNLQRRMAKQQKALFSLDLDRDNNQFNTYFTQLNRLQADYNDIISNFGNAFSDEQNRRLQLVGAELAEQIQQIQAKFQDTINTNLEDGKYNNLLKSLFGDFNKLQNPSNEIVTQIDNVTDALQRMRNANSFEELWSAYNDFQHNFTSAKSNIGLLLSDEKFFDKQKKEQEKYLKEQKKTQDRYDSITKAGRLGEFDLEFDDLENSLNQIREIEPKLSNAFNNLSQAKKQFDDTLRQSPNDIERVLNDYQRYQDAVENFNAEYNKAKHGQDNDDSTKNLQRRKDRLDYQMNSWLKDNSAAVKKYGKNIDDLKSKIQSCNDAQLDKIEKEFEDIDFAAKKAGLATQSFGDKLKAGITDEFTQLFSISRLFDYGVDAIRDMYDNVVEVDSAMVNLKKVTDETDATYNKFIDTSADTAIALGRSMSSYIEQTADWTKLGYTLKEAEELAKLSSVYANVAEIDDATAVSDMVTAMKAFNIETADAVQITDALNELGK